MDEFLIIGLIFAAGLCIAFIKSEMDEEEGMINIVGREPGTTTTTVEPIPGQFDAQSRLIERVKTDFAGYLARQDDVAKLKTNVANISNSVMRLKGLGG